MDKYDFNIVGSELYKFIWEDFCDNYIEFSKVSLDNISTKSTLLIVLTSIIKMLNPFMPYVTDEIYDALPIKDSGSIITSSYPTYKEEYNFDIESKSIDTLIEIITLIRNKKLEYNIPKGFGIINCLSDDYKNIIDNNAEILTKLVKCDIISSSLEEQTVVDLITSYGIIKLCFIGKQDSEEDI